MNLALRQNYDRETHFLPKLEANLAPIFIDADKPQRSMYMLPIMAFVMTALVALILARPDAVVDSAGIESYLVTSNRG